MTSIHDLMNEVVRFRNERDWKQFHRPKDMILSLMLEAAELAEHVQWNTDEEFLEMLGEKRDAVSDELADILYWLLLIAHDFEINLSKAFTEKMKKNELKYPVAASKGRKTKYTEL